MAARKQKIPTTTTMSVRLPFEQKEAIEKAAVDAKTTTSAYAARVLFEAATGKAPAQSKPPDPDQVEAAPPTIAKGIVVSDPKALDELRRIGININQIAHALNSGRDWQAKNLAQAVAKLFALLKEPEAFMARLAQMPAIPLPPTPKPAAPATSPETVMQKAPATVPRQPWPEPANAEPPTKPSVPPAPERRPIPPQVLNEIARELTAKPQAIVVQKPVPLVAAPPAAPVAEQPRRPRLIPPRRSRPRVDTPSEPKVPPPPYPMSPMPYAFPLPHAPTPTSAQPVTKDLRRDPPHPQTRHQLQDRAPVRPPRPGPAEVRKPGRLGFLSKLWGG